MPTKPVIKGARRRKPSCPARAYPDGYNPAIAMARIERAFAAALPSITGGLIQREWPKSSVDLLGWAVLVVFGEDEDSLVSTITSIELAAGNFGFHLEVTIDGHQLYCGFKATDGRLGIDPRWRITNIATNIAVSPFDRDAEIVLVPPKRNS